MSEANGKTKLLFVDVDGVLSVPDFPDAGTAGPRVGMPEEDWLEYCVRNGDASYAGCSAAPCAKRYAEKKKAEGAETFVLTAVRTSFEADAKRKFVREKYGGAFDRFVAVGNSSDKLPVILAIAKTKGARPEECEIVEDDYGTLIECHRAGIKATHVVSVAAWHENGETSGAEAPE